jgi:uncharacterized phage-associated protein
MALLAPKRRVSAHDVARTLQELLDHPSVLRTHKLCYYAQGFHLGRTGTLLFDDDIVAWVDGPVVPALDDEPPRHETELTDEERASIEAAIERYGRLDDRQLIRRTHNESPWLSASEREPDDRGRYPITEADLERFFGADRPGPSARRRAAMPSGFYETAHSLRTIDLTADQRAALDRAESAF